MVLDCLATELQITKVTAPVAFFTDPSAIKMIDAVEDVNRLFVFGCQ
jgi:hypothetical protein